MVTAFAFRWPRRQGRVIAPTLLLACVPLGGCLTIGADRLARDEIDFSRSLAISQNQQSLLNIVRLRYAEAPTFLDLTQVISGYQAQQSVTGTLDVYPRNYLNTFGGVGGSLQLQESPTFTYEPVTGEQFAETFLQPLSPAAVLPLALGGIPIDLLLDMVVQSVNEATNAQVLSGSQSGASRHFQLLVHDLRVLQVAGLLDVQVSRTSEGGDKPHGHDSGKDVDAHDGTWLVIRDSNDPALEAVVVDARRLLSLPLTATAARIVYGRHSSHGCEVAVLTRSLLGALGSIAFAIDVPPGDVASGRTLPTIASASPIVIHSGPAAPDAAFVAVKYDWHWYWIRTDDFRSKLAFAVLQNLLALATTRHAPGAVVTIPAG